MRSECRDKENDGLWMGGRGTVVTPGADDILFFFLKLLHCCVALDNKVTPLSSA